MKAYRHDSGRLYQSASLWEALGLVWKPHMVVSLVGAGGKTSVMYQLADEMASQGKKVVATTSTHIFYPEDRQVKLASKAWEAKGMVREGTLVVVGQLLPQEGLSQPRKLKSLPLKEIGLLAQVADLLLVEADGAKGLPLKVPASHEPVLAPQTDLVIGCCGLDCLGRTWREGCFRPELAGKLLGKPLDLDQRIRPGEVARILASEDGTRKGVGDKDYRVVLNKADGPREREMALEVLGMLHLEGIRESWGAAATFR